MSQDHNSFTKNNSLSDNGQESGRKKTGRNLALLFFKFEFFWKTVKSIFE